MTDHTPRPNAERVRYTLTPQQQKLLQSLNPKSGQARAMKGMTPDEVAAVHQEFYDIHHGLLEAASGLVAIMSRMGSVHLSEPLREAVARAEAFQAAVAKAEGVQNV